MRLRQGKWDNLDIQINRGEHSENRDERKEIK